MMVRTVSLKLLTSPEQSAALSALAKTFAATCNTIVPSAQEHRCWNRVALHHLVYYSMRETFSLLGSQMVCQAIHRVADAYKTLKSNGKIRKDIPIPPITFSPSSVTFDKRTYSFKNTTALSLFTLTGRTTIPFVVGKQQRSLLEKGTPKEARAIVRKGVWYFNLFLSIPDAPPLSNGGLMGIDVGENNLAATSTGKVLGGGFLRHCRDKYLALRRRLQSNGSRAAKRKLRTISGREQRHVKHVNHVTSKDIVSEALRAGVSEIRMEDLTNIRAHIRVGKRVRTRLHRWAFRQLQDFIAYKANAVGIRVVFVEPAYTSQTCSTCGAIGKRVKHSFACSCGTQRHSDVNASLNIAGFAKPIGIARGIVNCPKFAHQVPFGAVESPLF